MLHCLSKLRMQVVAERIYMRLAARQERAITENNNLGGESNE